MKVGAAVRIELGGTIVRGQVWDEADDGVAWVALQDGRYARVYENGRAQIVDARGIALGESGRVAA